MSTYEYLIAHRGNINGPIPNLENDPEYIQRAIDLGFYVEIDLWLSDYKYYLGHDYPIYKVNDNFLETNKNKLFIHCKNLEALDSISIHKPDFHYFWHEKDKYTLTSKNFIWVYPGERIANSSNIIVMDAELKHLPEVPVGGICSDYVQLLDLKVKECWDNIENEWK